MSSPLTLCTIASANFLDRVELLMNSFYRQHPDGTFFLLLCETPRLCREIAADTNLPILSPDQIGAPLWHDMAFWYDITEFNTALKPFLLRTLLSRGHTPLVYLDPDIEIYAPLSPIGEILTKNRMVLTPHLTLPLDDDGHSPSLDDFIRCGQFNLGFIAVRDDPDVESILRWWETVLTDRCLFETDHHFFVDQFWASSFPSFLDGIQILRDPGYNAAYWNLPQRRIRFRDGRWFADEFLLRFFHFSGISADDPARVSRHQTRVTVTPDEDLHRLLTGYIDRLSRTTLSTYREMSWSFSRYADGTPITREERRLWFRLSPDERLNIGDPFSLSGEERDTFRRQAITTAILTRDELAARLHETERQLHNVTRSITWRGTAPIRRIIDLLRPPSKT